jgi:predicted thioredoxin/glutaredoxin
MHKKLKLSMFALFVVVTLMLVGFTLPAGAKFGHDIVNNIVNIKGSIASESIDRANAVDEASVDDVAGGTEMTGVVESIAVDSWVVSGVTFFITTSTDIDENIVIGDTVDVDAISDGLGGYIATEICKVDLVDDDGDDELEMTGVVESISADTWVVSGVTFLVTASTEIDGTILVGDTVDVEAISDGLGGYVATEIDKVGSDDDSGSDLDGDKYEYIGVVESIAADSWVISGMTFFVTPSTDIDDNIVVGDTVDVDAISDGLGGYTATEICKVGSDDDADDSDTDDIDDELEMTGVVESISADTWVVSGVTFLVTASTEIDGTILVGDTVDVEAISDGLDGYVATEIGKVDPDDDADDSDTDDDEDASDSSDDSTTDDDEDASDSSDDSDTDDDDSDSDSDDDDKGDDDSDSGSDDDDAGDDDSGSGSDDDDKGDDD